MALGRRRQRGSSSGSLLRERAAQGLALISQRPTQRHGTSLSYKPKHKIRIVTAASLFDGHDAAINIMRRIMQRTGCEVIHLGHDRSVDEVVTTAIQEDAQAIAMTSYQGGHMEYFKYMKDLLDERGAGHIKIFGGGGGTILPEEIEDSCIRNRTDLSSRRRAVHGPSRHDQRPD